MNMGFAALRGPLSRARTFTEVPKNSLPDRAPARYQTARSYSIVIGAWSENFSAL